MPRTKRSGSFKPINDCIRDKIANGKSFNKLEAEVYTITENTPSSCFYCHDHVTFVIFYLPKSLNERDKGHWTVKAKDRAIWDGLISKAMCNVSFDKYTEGVVPFPIERPVEVEYTPYRTRFLDVDNSATGIKHPLDSMVHCGVLINDDRRYVVRYRPNPDVKVKSGEQRVEITLWFRDKD